MAKSYSEKLKDPRWQKKRLEIYQRDNFRCQSCGDDSETLHVHHVVPNYKAPWESELIDLITLCEDCHDIWHKLEKMGYDFCHIDMVIKLYDELEIQNVNYHCKINCDKPLFREAKFIHRKKINNE